MDSSFTPDEEDFELSLTPNLKHSERIARSMRVVSYEEAKGGVSRYIEEPLHEKGELTSWDSSFAEYIEEHKNSKLIFCWYARGVGVVFSPADHHGYLSPDKQIRLDLCSSPDPRERLPSGLAQAPCLECLRVAPPRPAL